MAATLAENEAFPEGRRRFTFVAVVVVMMRENIEIVQDLPGEIRWGRRGRLGAAGFSRLLLGQKNSDLV